MNDRAREWGLFADRALVLQLAVQEERLDRALAAGTGVFTPGRWKTGSWHAVGTDPGSRE